MPCNVSRKVFHGDSPGPRQPRNPPTRLTGVVRHFAESVPRCSTTPPAASESPHEAHRGRATFREKCSTMFHHAAGSLGIPHEAHRARATFREKRSTMFHHAAGSLGIPHEAHRARATFREKRSTMFHHAAEIGRAHV